MAVRLENCCRFLVSCAHFMHECATSSKLTTPAAHWHRARRKVTVSEFKGRWYVNVREYYTDAARGGKEAPTQRGLSMTEPQWAAAAAGMAAFSAALPQ
jgi:hypothetical protein